MITDISSWEEFYLKDLFTIKGSKTTPKAKLQAIGVGSYPYITTRATNHGVDGLYNHYTEVGNCLTIDSAVLGSCFYQSRNFSASDHVELLIPKYPKFNKYHGLFLQTIINKKNRGVFSYANKCNQTRIKETVIKLPVKVDKTPDWEQIEAIMKDIETKFT